MRVSVCKVKFEGLGSDFCDLDFELKLFFFWLELTQESNYGTSLLLDLKPKSRKNILEHRVKIFMYKKAFFNKKVDK